MVIMILAMIQNPTDQMMAMTAPMIPITTIGAIDLITDMPDKTPFRI
jgi:hypothetical protein